MKIRQIVIWHIHYITRNLFCQGVCKKIPEHPSAHLSKQAKGIILIGTEIPVPERTGERRHRKWKECIVCIGFPRHSRSMWSKTTFRCKGLPATISPPEWDGPSWLKRRRRVSPASKYLCWRNTSHFFALFLCFNKKQSLSLAWDGLCQ